MTTDTRHLGPILKKARELAGIKQSKIALLAHCTVAHVCNIENGRRELPPGFITVYDQVIGTNGLLAAGLEGGEMRRRIILDALGLVASLGIVNPSLVTEALRMSLITSLGTDDWHEITKVHGHQFMTNPAATSKQRTAAHLLILRKEISASDSPIPRIAAARLMTLQGMATANLGDITSAAGWYRSARAAADSTDDIGLQKWVRGREGFRRYYEGASVDEVLNLVTGVNDVEALLAAAQAYARLDRRASALEALATAQRLYDRTDHRSETIYVVQPWRLALAKAYVYALLGDLAKSQQVVDQIRPPSTMVRWQALLDMHRAFLMSKAGQQTEALELASSIMRLHPTDQRSALITHTWNEIAGAA